MKSFTSIQPRSFFWVACVIASIAITRFATAADAPAKPAVDPGPNFLIGVWYQPLSSFDKWKARGVNTLVGYPENSENISREQWLAAAKKAGFYYIAKPTEDPDDIKSDLADDHFLAWEQQDEPDGAGATPADKIQEKYKAWKQLGNKNVLLNLDGPRFQYSKPADYIPYCQGADWLAFDYYVLNRGDGPANLKKIGEAIDLLKQWSGGKKKIFVFIECSDQDLRISDFGALKGLDGQPIGTKMRGPTPDEMKAEIDIAVQHGAAGIVYFPQVIGKGWENFDGTTTDVETAGLQRF